MVSLNNWGVDRQLPVSMLDTAVALLSQQCWCWGQDIMRPDGNWLLERGFTRIVPVQDGAEHASIYRMALPENQQIILRGFGVFFGQTGKGSVFLPRFKFSPVYSKEAEPNALPWTEADVSYLKHPKPDDRHTCATLLLGLLDWIREYEIWVGRLLGVEYREQTLTKWDDGKRPVTRAAEFASAWRRLSFQIAADIDSVLRYQ